jgi:hypothetical protein
MTIGPTAGSSLRSTASSTDEKRGQRVVEVENRCCVEQEAHEAMLSNGSPWLSSTIAVDGTRNRERSSGTAAMEGDGACCSLHGS